MLLVYIILGSFVTFLVGLRALSYHLYYYSRFMLRYGCLMMFAWIWAILTLIWVYFDSPQMSMRCYTRGAREEHNFGSSQDHGPTMVPAMDRSGLCNCDLFVFSSAVWLNILMFFYINSSLSSKEGEHSID